MQHVVAFGSSALLLAFATAELDTARDKQGSIRRWVSHFNQSRVEVDF